MSFIDILSISLQGKNPDHLPDETKSTYFRNFLIKTNRTCLFPRKNPFSGINVRFFSQFQGLSEHDSQDLSNKEY